MRYVWIRLFAAMAMTLSMLHLRRSDKRFPMRSTSSQNFLLLGHRALLLGAIAGRYWWAPSR
jgi:hypothetical protein